jgi:hypothetical protein
MRKFPKQIMLLTLGLILFGSVASRANASSHSGKTPTTAVSNCSPSSTGPLEASSSYAFQALGADSLSTVPGAVATTTLVGSFVTDSKGCPTSGYIASNDNGTTCTGTFVNTLVEGSPTNTGTLTWVETTDAASQLAGCFATIKFDFVYASASGFSDVLYFSSNGTDVFTFAGKAQENGPTGGD